MTARRAAAALVIVAMLAVTGCSGKQSPTPNPPKDLPSADPVVKQLAEALAKGDVSGVPMTDSAVLAEGDRKTIMAGMDGLLPSVTPAGVEYADETATAKLEQKVTIGSQTWSWPTTATLKYTDGAWKVVWKASVVQSDLDGRTRLRHRRELPKRASIIGAGNKALVEVQTAYRVGIDKANLDKGKWASTATALAQAVKVDAAAYAKQVTAAGPMAFVPAITMREGMVPEAARTMPGVKVVPAEMPLAPSSTFAVGILGGAGQASPEVVKASKGDVQAGDIVGTSGLQKRYDAQLRGTVGHHIEVVTRNPGTESRLEGDASPSPSASADATASPSSGPSPDGSGAQAVKELFTVPAKPGTDVVLSLDRELQARAETVLAQQKGIASLAVVKVGSGDLVVAANSPASKANPDATFGRYSPGSTFKVVSALALLRKGMSPSSTLPCTPTVTVNGRVFKNYADFPSSATGNVPMSTALANSCNTAFISQWQKVTPADLASAAASLGMGTDYDAGYASFFGSVPSTDNPTTRAANMIGQGQVEASPMAMAAVAASVASGKTVVPWLVASKKPNPSGTPLTAAEAGQLQALMKAVVNEGSGRVLASQMTGAKTGTAEFGDAKPPKTHAWMIAWNDTYAVAALVNEGESGSKTAAPIIKAFLAGR